MSDKPAYLETWGFWSYEGPHNDPTRKKRDKHGASVCIGDIRSTDEEGHECLATVCADTEERAQQRARMAAAAPALARALLLAEWGDKNIPRCPSCDAPDDSGHEVDCPVDVALKQAGFPDKASREAAMLKIENNDP